MANQIIKGPNGLYGVFSTDVDMWVLQGAVAEDVIDFFVERAAMKTRASVQRMLGSISRDNAEKIYAQFTLTFEEANERHEESTTPRLKPIFP